MTKTERSGIVVILVKVGESEETEEAEAGKSSLRFFSAIIENEKSLRFPWTIVQRNVGACFREIRFDKMEDVTRMSV